MFVLMAKEGDEFLGMLGKASGGAALKACKQCYAQGGPQRMGVS